MKVDDGEAGYRDKEEAWYRANGEAENGKTGTGKRLIIVFSHTTVWDFVLFLLYRSFYSDIRDELRIVMKPQPFKHWGWFLRSIGCIPATRAEDKGEGFVDRTVRNFVNKSCKIALSPKGKMAKSEWRSGYYHLRRGLKADIVVAGLDYERRCLYMGPVHSHSEVEALSESELGRTLKEDMGAIVPLYPDCSEVDITREYDSSKIGLINWVVLTLVLLIVILLCICVYILIESIRGVNVENG